jgi:hypothetical protein
LAQEDKKLKSVEVPDNLELQAGWNVLDSLPIGLRKCLCKVSLICILHPVRSVPRFSLTLSHTFPHLPTPWPLKTLLLLSVCESHEKDRETYPERPGFLNLPTPTKHGTRHFIALPFLLHPAGNRAFLVDPILNVSNPAGRPPTDAYLES